MRIDENDVVYLDNPEELQRAARALKRMMKSKMDEVMDRQHFTKKSDKKRLKKKQQIHRHKQNTAKRKRKEKIGE